MYYPFYNNPFYYPTGAYMQNICSYGYAQDTYNTQNANKVEYTSNEQTRNNTLNDNNYTNNVINNDFFSINGDRLEVFGISINIDDLIILIMLFFMFRESQIDYSIIIILALILFDQN